MRGENYIKDIALELLKDYKTIREVASITSISKSKIHKDIHTILPKVDIELYNKVLELLAYNKKIRHLRGGYITKQKYIKHQ